jgi:RNA polymerase sigma-70 factor (ECF subfamily)
MSLLSFLCQSRELRQKLEQSRDRLYRMAYAWCHDPDLADDLVQETLAKALKHADKVRDRKALDAWLFRILSNCWRDHFRRAKETIEFDEADHGHEVTPEDIRAREEIVSSVRAAVAALPEGQRQTVTLVDLEGFSYAEVAEILDVPVGTVMSRLCRARRLLKEHLLAPPQLSETTRANVRLVK